MTHEVAKVLAESLAPLYNESIVTVLSGLVKTASQERSGKTIRFPVPYDYDAPVYQIENIDLIPDQKQRAIIYFEGDNTDLTSFEAKKSRARTSVKLICWYNSNAFDPSLPQSTIHTLLVSNVLTLLKTARPNPNGVIAGFEVKPTKTYDSTEALFTKYSYRDERGQYLQHPYFAFGIDITVDYQINHGCTIKLLPVPADNCC